MFLVFPEHGNTIPETEIWMTFFMIHPAYLPQYKPVPDNLLPCKENTMAWIIHMRRFRPCTVHFDNAKRFPLFQFFPTVVTNIEPAIIKIFDLPAYPVNTI